MNGEDSIKPHPWHDHGRPGLKRAMIGRALCLSIFTLLTVSMLVLGNAGTPIFTLYMVVPLAAAVASRYDLWFWSTLSAVTPALIYLAQWNNISPPALHDSQYHSLLYALTHALGVIVASLIAGFWVSHQSSANRRSIEEAAAHRMLVNTAMMASSEVELHSAARKLLGHLASANWVSSVCFWDTRGIDAPEKPLFTLPGSVEFNSSSALGRAMRSGERSVPMESEQNLQGVCYPIRAGESVIGVIEVQLSKADNQRNECEWLMQQVAIQLGHVAEREIAAETFQKEAQYDSLTNLPNRRAFHDILEDEIDTAGRAGNSLALLFIDLNGFKRINDSLGHASGDKVLQVVAQRLERAVRSSDMLCPSTDRAVQSVARVGGDEFTLVLDNIRSPADADTAAQRILDGLESPIRLHGQEFKVGASIGIAVFPDDADNVDSLIRSADTAMYNAKRRGGSGFSRYRTSDKAVDSLKLEAEIRQALAEDQFEMHYQPVFSCESGAVIGAEALIRWRHPERGWVPPSQFIPLAEKTGLICEIGHFQFQSVIQWFEASRSKLPDDFRIALNLSPTQIEDTSFVAWLAGCLAGSSLPMNQLELEITETALLADTPETRDHLRALSGLGVCITLDDFGTGQSSLSLLKRFPIGRIKVDRSFVSGLPDRSEDVAIVGAVLSLAQALEIPVVAEGVEDEKQRLFLTHRNCDDMQGFLLAKPMPGAELARRVMAKNLSYASNECKALVDQANPVEPKLAG